MSGGVAHRVSLGLDNTTGKPPSGRVVHHGFADQVACQLNGVDRQFRAAQEADALRWFILRWCAHGFRVASLGEYLGLFYHTSREELRWVRLASI